MSANRSYPRIVLLTLLAMLAVGSTAALVASVGSALDGSSAECPLSPSVSPPDLSPPDVSPPVSPPDCPPLSPPLSPPAAVPTRVAYTGPTTMVNGTFASLTARLNQMDTTPIGGELLEFTLGSGFGAQSCSALTAPDGSASCAIFSVAQSRGLVPLTVRFAGNSSYLSSFTSSSVTVSTATTLSDLHPTTVANGRAATLSARLNGPGTAPAGGEPVTLTLGTDLQAQSCTGDTDTNGVASCEIPTVNQPLGPNIVTAEFAAQDYYLGSADSEATMVFEYTTGGAFALGDVSAGSPTVGNVVTFWGSRWAKSNTLSEGAPPRQMTGFVSSSPIPECAASWTTRAGNSGLAPSTVPTYTAMIVTSRITTSGGVLGGNTVHLVVVRTDAHYGSNPGRTGQGTIVAVIC